MRNVRRHHEHLARGHRHAAVGQHHIGGAFYHVVQSVAEIFLLAHALARRKRHQHEVNRAAARQAHARHLARTILDQFRNRTSLVGRQIPKSHMHLSVKRELGHFLQGKLSH